MSSKVRHAKIIFSHMAGPLVQWDGEFLHVEDLNPQIQTSWRMSRGELLGLGWKAMKAAVLGR
jgi:hypothetical protein